MGRKIVVSDAVKKRAMAELGKLLQEDKDGLEVLKDDLLKAKAGGASLKRMSVALEVAGVKVSARTLASAFKRWEGEGSSV